MDNATRGRFLARLGVAVAFLAIAWLQTGPAVSERPAGEPWFLYGRDTVSHDAPVQIWVWRAVAEGRGELPLWMPELKGGLPTVGAFLWTPMAPSLWLHAVLPFPDAQRLQFLLAFWWAALGSYWLGRTLGLQRWPAIFAGVAFGFCGHLVTLVHAGHLQKVLALAWLPWFAGGAAKAFGADGNERSEWRGTAVAGMSLGMAFLSGHPQIAWLMLALGGARAAFAAATTRRWRPAVARFAGVAMLGGLLGGAQMVPGLEMGALSNRADGVEWEEAVETSYPPGELPELLLPRFRGDSSRAGYDLYMGAWGERLVSDYAGVLVALFALGAPMVRSQRREAGFWWAVAAFFLLVGAGRHAPLYRLLYEFAPGFRSFRSPGTFMAGAALALPVLAAQGLQGLSNALEGSDRRTFRIVQTVGIGAVASGLLWALGKFNSAPSLGSLATELDPDRDAVWKSMLLWSSVQRSALVAGAGLAMVPLAFALRHLSRSLAWTLPAGLAILTAGDLVSANSAFLIAEPWKNYRAYLAPAEIDARLANERRPLRVLEPGSEMSLRPVLAGRDAMLGYHPIGYRAFEENLRDLGLGTPEWRDQWGVDWIAAKGIPPDAPKELVRVATLADGRTLARDGSVREVVRAVGGDDRLESWQWLLRSPNETVLEVTAREGTAVEIAETMAPGWTSEPPAGPADGLLRRTEVPAGTSEIRWTYRPASWSRGVFFTAMGAMAAAAMLLATRRRNA